MKNCRDSSVRVCIALGLLMLIHFPVATVAQQFPPGPHDDGVEMRPMDKPSGRAKYFHDRVTFPGGEVPEGARVRAWKHMNNEMQMYAPSDKHSTHNVLEWRNVGPYNIGGRIIALAVNPLNSNTIFIGAAGGGIWRTRDEGETWRSVSDEFPTQAMGAMLIDPVDTNILYAGTGEASYAQRTFDGGGTFKSTDGGDTWVEIGVGTLPQYGRVSDMVINPSNTSILYAAIPDGMRDPSLMGIWRSRDAGETWTLVLEGRMSDIVINPQNPDILYTASSKVFGGGTAARYGMFKTTDGGDNWEQLDIGVVDSLMGRTSIGLCDASPDVLYIGVSHVTGGDRTPLLGVFKTTNGGEDWIKLDVPFDYMVSQGWFDNVMGVHPENPDIVYAGGVKMIFTTDGGTTWTRVPDQGYGGILHVDQHAIQFNRQDPSTVYVGNDGGFFIGRRNGEAWEKKDNGLSITQFIGGAMHPSSDEVAFGGTQDNGTMITLNNGPDFDHVLYGDGGNGAINPEKPNIIYTTKETLKVYRSEDFGQTWTRIQNGMSMDRSLFYIDYAMDMNNPDVLYLGTYRLYKTTNGGDTWRQMHSCLLGLSNSCYYITSVFVAPYDGNIVMAGSTIGGVAISKDAGESWHRVPHEVLPVAYLSSIRSYRPGVFYATFSRYGVPKVWRSLDSAETWEDISGNLPDIPANDVIEMDGSLILATDLGVFVSEDDGNEWKRLGVNLPSVSVQRLQYNKRTGTLRAITHGRGMYDLRWKQLPSAIPVFESLPDTTAAVEAALFVYAPVTNAVPPARYTLVEGPSGATVDSTLGVVRWVASASEARFTIEAYNDLGSVRQVFTLHPTALSTADWQVVQALPMITAVNVLARGEDNSLWLGRDSAFVSRSIDNGMTWTEHSMPIGTAAIQDMHAFDGMNAIAGTRGGQIFRTSDGGGTWVALKQDVNAAFSNIHFHDPMHGIAVTSDRDRIDLAFVYETTDGGASWELISTPSARFPIERTLTFTDTRHGWFASSNLSRPAPDEAVILSTTDGGRSWTESRVTAHNISGLSFLNETHGFCVDDMSGVVRRTTNGGLNWRATFYPMAGKRNVAVHADASTGAIWIVNDDEAWVSRNLGNSWKKTTLAPAGGVQGAAFADSASGWVVSKSGIVQRLRVSPLLTASLPSRPDDIRLFPGYPNPLSAEQNVSMHRFVLDRSRHVVLDVFNSAGVRVARLVDGTLPAGEHLAAFDGAALPGGVYFIHLSTGTISRTSRILLLR